MPKKLTYEFVKSEFEKRGYELLETEYVNGRTKMRYRCPKHPNMDLRMTYKNFYRGSGCPCCAKDEYPTYEEIYNLFKKRGYDLLEKEYKNCKTKMRYQCPHHPGKELSITSDSLISGSGCPYCAKNAKYTYEFIYEEFNKRGYDLLEKEYKNCDTPMQYRCRKHPYNDLEIAYSSLKQGHGCRFCASEKTGLGLKHTFEFICNEFKKRGYKLLSEKYINSGEKLYYICLTHPDTIQQISWDAIKQGQCCKFCTKEYLSEKSRHKHDDYANIASKINPHITILEEYEFGMKEIKVMCNQCGQQWKHSTKSIKYKKVRCPSCDDGISFPNKFMFNILTSLNIRFEREKAFEWCSFKINKKEHRGFYDFVFSLNDVNYIVEMDGGFHKVAHSKGRYNIEDIKNIDYYKTKLAEDNEYVMIRIDCKESEFSPIKKNIIDSALNNVLDLRNVDWDICYKKSLSSKVIEACHWFNLGKTLQDISLLLDLNPKTVTRYLAKGNDLHLCEYERTNKRRCVCLTTKEIFESLAKAAHISKANVNCILGCCRDITKSTLYKTIGIKSTWEYYDKSKDYTGYIYVA